MVGIVMVSHSAKLADGVADLTKMMAAECPVAAAGGLEDGSFGTSYEKIRQAVEAVRGADGVVVLMDMGSAVMTTEMVLEDLGYPDVKMVDCPIVEGAVAATVTAAGGGDLDAVIEQAMCANQMKKLIDKGWVKFDNE